MKTILILGSTGLVGKQLLHIALKRTEYKHVIVFNRRPSGVKHPKLTEYITDFTKIPNLTKHPKIDSIFSCLGTTKRKTPNKDDYFNLEVNLPVSIAKEFLQKELINFHYISSVGADSKSSAVYMQRKGIAEEQLAELSIPNLYIYRPSILSGDRQESRLFEDLAVAACSYLDLFFSGKYTKYKTMKTNDLAEAMITIDLAKINDKKRIYHYDEITHYLQ